MPKPKDPITGRMVQLMSQLAPLEGYNLSPLDEVRFLRSNRPLTRTPVLYEPGIVILCQGRKRGYLGDEVYVYDAQHYLVVSVPVPFTMETDASETEPMLAVYVHLDFALAGELIQQVDKRWDFPRSQPMGMYASPLDEPLRRSTLRFLEVMSNDADAQILGPAMLRELYYRILTGEQGGTLRAAIAQQGQFGKVTRAIHKIHSCYHQHLDVETLAEEAQMSVPNFHLHFSQGYRFLADAVSEVDAAAPGAIVDAAQRPDCGKNCISGRLRKRLAIQPRFQTPLRPHTPGGSGVDETSLCVAGTDDCFAFCVVALTSLAS